MDSAILKNFNVYRVIIYWFLYIILLYKTNYIGEAVDNPIPRIRISYITTVAFLLGLFLIFSAVSQECHCFNIPKFIQLSMASKDSKFLTDSEDVS